MTKEEKKIQSLNDSIASLRNENRELHLHLAMARESLVRKEEYNHALVDRVNKITADWINFSRLIKIIKATVNGVKLQGEDTTCLAETMKPNIVQESD